METALVCVSGLGGFAWWLRFIERRDVRRFEQRAELLKLRAASLKAEDLTKVEQRVARLELKGLR